MMKNRANRLISLFLIAFILFTFLSACSNADTEISSSLSKPIGDESIPNSASENESDYFSEDNSSVHDDSEPEDISDAEISKEPEDIHVSFLACPDNIIHPSVFYDAIERAARENNATADYSDLHNAIYDFKPIYQNVADAIKNADIAYINQETLIGGTSGKIIGYPCFNSPSAVADTVIDLGFDVVNVAHNHMLDSGDTRYLENCNTVFESKGIEVIGYYPDEASTENITVLESKGIKIAFLAYTYGTNGLNIPSNSSFVIPYFSESLVSKQVALAKELADVVIVSCHWGYEDTFNVNDQQRKYANLMCELGVDVILGMHPHVIQPMEWKISSTGYKTLVVYSLGNFVSGMVAGKNMLAGMLSLNITKDAITGNITIETPLFIPTVTHYTKNSRVASNDTGYRNFEIYYLSDYTEEMASEHGVCIYERSHSPTLVGGAFSKKTLLETLYKYIPEKFLPEEYISAE